MLKKFIAIFLLGYVGYFGFDYYRAKLHTRPEMPDGAFSLSYKNGLLAIMVNLLDERDTRRYFGFPSKVPFYLKNTWSFCYPPTKDESLKFNATRQKNPGERFEAICKVKIEDEIVVRGIITTVPKM